MNIVDELNIYYKSEDYGYDLIVLCGEEIGVPVTLFFSSKPVSVLSTDIYFKVNDDPKQYRSSFAKTIYAITQNYDSVCIKCVSGEQLPSQIENDLQTFISINYNIIKTKW